MVTSNGSSPLTVRGLDPGMMYSVIINVFDGSQVVLIGRVERKSITVMGTSSSKICDCVTYIAIYCICLWLCTVATYIATEYIYVNYHVYMYIAIA